MNLETLRLAALLHDVGKPECWAEGAGFKGPDLDKYELALLGGDADKIGNFINQSRRLPDLMAGSKIVKEATEKTVTVIRENSSVLNAFSMLVEGSFLALSPRSRADEMLKKAEEAFTDFTGGELTKLLFLQSIRLVTSKMALEKFGGRPSGICGKRSLRGKLHGLDLRK